MIPAKEFEGELWIKASDHHQAIKDAKREWKGLTDEAIWWEYQRFWPFHPSEEPTLAKDIVKFARAIEAKSKEKNFTHPSSQGHNP